VHTFNFLVMTTYTLCLQRAGGGINGLWVGLALYHIMRMAQHCTFIVTHQPLRRALIQVRLEQRKAALDRSREGEGYGRDGDKAMSSR
jgi:hypothetical protein